MYSKDTQAWLLWRFSSFCFWCGILLKPDIQALLGLCPDAGASSRAGAVRLSMLSKGGIWIFRPGGTNIILQDPQKCNLTHICWICALCCTTALSGCLKNARTMPVGLVLSPVLPGLGSARLSPWLKSDICSMRGAHAGVRQGTQSVSVHRKTVFPGCLSVRPLAARMRE